MSMEWDIDIYGASDNHICNLSTICSLSLVAMAKRGLADKVFEDVSSGKYAAVFYDIGMLITVDAKNNHMNVYMNSPRYKPEYDRALEYVNSWGKE
jgi:hypothetical protein